VSGQQRAANPSEPHYLPPPPFAAKCAYYAPYQRAQAFGFAKSHPNMPIAAPARSAEPNVVLSRISGRATSNPPTSASTSMATSLFVIPPSTLRCASSDLTWSLGSCYLSPRASGRRSPRASRPRCASVSCPLRRDPNTAPADRRRRLQSRHLRWSHRARERVDFSGFSIFMESRGHLIALPASATKRKSALLA